MLMVEEEDNYNNEFKRNSYNDLLDTFVLSFDSSNMALKDISAYNTGNTVTTDYGLSFDVPVEWSKRGWGREMSYAKEDAEQSLSVQVTSASSGDTLKDWVSRQEKFFTDSFVEGYREIQGAKETSVDGIAALENRYAVTMGDKWQQFHVIYIIKDKYKYEISFAFPKTGSSEEIDGVIGTFLKSVHFSKDAVNGSLGFIQDEEDLMDPNRTVTYTNKKYLYTMRAPEGWNEGYQGEFDSPIKQFTFEGGGMFIMADDRSNLEEAVNRMEQEHKKNAEADANYKYTVTDEAMFDTTVKKFSTQYKSKNVPYISNDYVFEKNNIIYTIRLRINDAVKTDQQWERLENTLRSIQFLDK